MTKHWLQSATARLHFGYRAKLLLIAALAAALPIALLSRHAPMAAGLSLLAAAALLYVLHGYLRPLALAAHALRESAEGRDAPDLPLDRRDEAGRMLADVHDLTTKLAGLRYRMANRHSVSALPTREPFLAEMAMDIRASHQPTLLGVIRFADYDRLAAFDHAAADRALKAFALRLAEAVGEGRPLAQVDRDCFALWFRDVAQTQTAAAELQALGYVLGQDLDERGLKIAPEVALAAAVFPDDWTEPAGLLSRALAALPKAGHSGSGKVAYFSSESSAAARQRFDMEQALRQAIAREQLTLCYQPVVDLDQGRVTGAEALLRWTHPEFGQVPPSEFVPILEESGMMEEVGLWVLDTACREARAWEAQGLTDLTMSVNLSARQLRDPNLEAVIVRLLERHRLAPSALELELTETATMEDAARTRQLFGNLLAMGVSVAIDDFGAGYSSLSYLKQLPFSKLKIDREFIAGVDKRGDSQAICRALVELTRGLGIACLAEGVETREEVRTLRRLGCRLFQGYVFARPLASDVFASTITDPAWLSALAPTPPVRLATVRRRAKS